MHRTLHLIRALTSVAVALGAIATLALPSATAAGKNTTDNGGIRKYVLTATGTWGPAQDAAVQAAGGTVVFSHGPSGLGMASSASPIFDRELQRSGAFAHVDQDMQVQWFDPTEKVYETDLVEQAVTPGDETFINEQWNLIAIEAAGAWDAGYTGAGVRVAILDGGLYDSHVDLAGHVDVAHSTSFIPGHAFNEDTGTFWHGTHVAGIVGAADNGFGTIGVAPDATLIGVKVLHDGSGNFGQLIAGLLYASDSIDDGGAGADIINCSLGNVFLRGGGNTGIGPLVAAVAKAVNYATSKGVLVVVAAGNNGADLDHAGNYIVLPAEAGSAIAVSATGPVGYAVGWPNGATNFRRPASYTNYGNSLVWVAAPGGDFAYPGDELCSIPACCGGTVIAPCWAHDMVISTARGSGTSTTGYAWAPGTSMAAPVVSGVAALIKQKYPGISVGDLKNVLANTADDEGPVGNDPYYGKGFVNARRAVTEPWAMASQTESGRVATEPATSGVEFVITGNGTRGIPTMSFTLPNAGRVSLSLFDLAGRKVAVLFDGEAAAGRTTVSWDGRGLDGKSLRQGAYFARFDADGVAQGRRIVLLGQ